MIDKVSVTFPDDQYLAVMGEFMARSKRTMMDTINSRMLDILIKAYMYTKIADKAQIQAKLGAILLFGRFMRKTGEFRRYKHPKIAVVEGFSLAYAIIQKRYRDKHGGKWMPVEDAKKKSVQMIKLVSRSVGFIRSGWIPGLKKFNTIVRAARERLTGIAEDRTALAEAGQVVGKPKGWGYPARNMEVITAEIANTTKVAEPIAGPALKRAIEESKAWMISKIKADIQKGAIAPIEGKQIG